LRRTRVGKVTIQDCVNYDHFAEWLDTIEIDFENN